MTRRWSEIAIEAGRELAGEPGESVLARRAAVAARMGVARDTLHNYVEALRFVHEIEAEVPAAAAAMLTLPATVVGVYARWWRRDRQAVEQHAVRAAAEHWPARRIVADERAARLADTRETMLQRALAGISGPRQASEVSPALAVALGRRLASPPGLGQLRPARNVEPLSLAMGAADVLRWDDPVLARFGLPEAANGDHGLSMADLGELARDDGGLDLVAVIEQDRGAPGDAHRRNARNVIARAAVVSSVLPVALVLLPDSAALSEFVAAVPVLEAYRLHRGDAGVEAFGLPGARGAVVAMAVEGFASAWSGVE